MDPPAVQRQQSAPQNSLHAPPTHTKRRSLSTPIMAQEASSQVSVFVSGAEQRDNPGGLTSFTAYLVNVTIATPVVVRFAEKSGATTLLAIENNATLKPMSDVKEQSVSSSEQSSRSLAEVEEIDTMLDLSTSVSSRQRRTKTSADAHPLLKEDDEPSQSTGRRVSKDRMGFKRKVLIVEKRYSEFLNFHRLWKQKYPNIDRKEQRFFFPRKKFLFNMDKEFIEGRRKALDLYVQSLNRHPALRKELYRFLEIDHLVLDIMKKATGSASSWIEEKDDEDDPKQRRKINVFKRKQTRDDMRRSILRKKDERRNLRKGKSRKELDQLAKLKLLDSVAAEKDADDWWTKMLFLRAIIEGKLDVVKAAVDAGMDVNGPLGYHQEPPLVWAIHSKMEHVADFLLSIGAKQPSYIQRRVVPPGARALNIKRWRHSGLADSASEDSDSDFDDDTSVLGSRDISADLAGMTIKRQPNQ